MLSPAQNCTICTERDALMKTDNEILRIADLQAFYGESHVLHGVELGLNKGEVVSVLGRNGAGRSTTLKCIVGLVNRRKGSIIVNGRETIGLPPEKIARLGIGYCPEERGIFSSLSCEENLLLPPMIGPNGMSLEEIYTMFPNLKKRRKWQGTRLSGGEQQMLAVGRILRTGAQLLLLDEISEGLAPVIVQLLGGTIGTLRKRGYSMVIVEQNFRFAAPISDSFYVLEHGVVVQNFQAAEIDSKMMMLHEFLGV